MRTFVKSKTSIWTEKHSFTLVHVTIWAFRSIQHMSSDFDRNMIINFGFGVAILTKTDRNHIVIMNWPTTISITFSKKKNTTWWFWFKRWILFKSCGKNRFNRELWNILPTFDENVKKKFFFQKKKKKVLF